ncbi:MAG: PEP-CTERM sorting domain-containing protein [Rivularia sp. (in: cyanobacteria)]
MSLNFKKLAVATAVVASTIGLFGESAEAQTLEDIFGFDIPIVQHSGDSDIKLNEQQLRGSLNILTSSSFNNAVEDFSLTNLGTDEILFTSAMGSVEPELLETENQLEEFLDNLGLNAFDIDRDDVFARIPDEAEEPIAAYVVNLNNDLNPNEQAQLVLFYDNNNSTGVVPGGLPGLTDSTAGVVNYEGTETVPGVLIRDFREGLDDDMSMNVINGRTVDRFGVGVDFPVSNPFSVTLIPSPDAATVPEPTTGNSLLIAGAFGGLFILKRNQRIRKSQAKIEN